ncbi:antibiotic biosynthesis monooxygenase [bacterium]|nr:antibiotic biosynthesis monooxygenase [bacterium]
MAVKILIYRTISDDQETVVRPLLKELRKFALKSKGYISGESLISGENLEDQLIISSWESRDDWENFLESNEPKQIRYQVDQILGRESVYKLYYSR